MLEISFLNSSDLAQIVLLVLSLGLTFFSLRIGAWLWFISSWCWLGFAVVANSSWPSGVASLMALLCVLIFLRGGKR